MPVLIGTTVTVTARIRDNHRRPADPTAITFTVVAPDGTETVYDIDDFTRDSLGLWGVEFVLDQVGRWRWHITTTGGVAAVSEGSLIVRALTG